jgi:hypothetical protein
LWIVVYPVSLDECDAIAVTVLIAGTGVMDGIAGCLGAIFEPYFEVDVVWDWHGEFDPEQAGERRN